MKIDTDKQLNYLKNGTAVITRRLMKSDRKIILDGFEALSQLSRYRRFLHNKNNLQQSEIDCLFTTPQRHGVSFMVLECKDASTLAEGRCIGLIQLIELESPNACAEIALVVIDEFHNCGLGKLMLKTIEIEAVKRKIQHLYFYTTADNQPLNAILKRTGWAIRIERELGSVTYIIKVKQNAASKAVRKSVKADNPVNVNYPDLLNQGQLLATSWFKVCLKIIIFMNQFKLLVNKNRL